MHKKKMFAQFGVGKKGKKKGFTLIELLVVIGIIGILAAVVLVAVNPAHQFALARDSQRLSNVTAILDAVGQNMAENKGVFTCNGSAIMIPQSPEIMRKTAGSDPSTSFDIADCLVPTYLSSMPYDPSATGAHYTTDADYDTEYHINQEANGRIDVSASSEINPSSPIIVIR